MQKNKKKTEMVRKTCSNYCLKLKLWQEIFIITNIFSKWFVTRKINIILAIILIVTVFGVKTYNSQL